jgi:hypothetical protein
MKYVSIGKQGAVCKTVSQMWLEMIIAEPDDRQNLIHEIIIIRHIAV